ncbi:MAG TPA: TadE/TadG family type IV pilus assembly protein [Gaiellales bacterium]|jgi:Flp pilus assembly protein TadG|nr:TadE/TadG family type IV pilus assembly protein [Gaiellales bacterium]
MTRVKRQRRDGQRGAAMVEFALVLPILLLVVFGIFDFGRAINYWIDSTHIANEAARYAAVGNKPTGCTGSLASCMRAQADSGELSNGSSSVTERLKVCVNQPSSTTPGAPITATAEFTYQWFSFLGISATSTQITQSATMRLEHYDASVVGCAS